MVAGMTKELVLPNDLAACHAMIREQQRAAAAQASANAEEAQEEARRQQRAALILNYMRSTQPRLLPPP
jgi:hypothetical protein